MLKVAGVKNKKYYWIGAIALLGFTDLCFTTPANDQLLWLWSNKCLAESFADDGSQRLKKWELSLTSDDFIRLRKTYPNGKQEYFSFHVHRFKDFDYLGTTVSGVLTLKTMADDVIVQTYNDPKGDIDTMATSLSISVKNMAPERLDSLRGALIYFKEKK